jgi:hypothetical protein
MSKNVQTFLCFLLVDRFVARHKLKILMIIAESIYFRTIKSNSNVKMQKRMAIFIIKIRISMNLTYKLK